MIDLCTDAVGLAERRQDRPGLGHPGRFYSSVLLFHFDGSFAADGAVDGDCESPHARFGVFQSKCCRNFGWTFDADRAYCDGSGVG